MTYLEKYMQDFRCTEKDFWIKQVASGGFCPDDVSVDDCEYVNLSCRECWGRDVE